jgi:hypothetical protein
MSLEPITLSQSYATKGFTMMTFQVQDRWVVFLKAGLGIDGEKSRPGNRGNRRCDKPCVGEATLLPAPSVDL